MNLPNHRLQTVAGGNESKVVTHTTGVVVHAVHIEHAPQSHFVLC